MKKTNGKESCQVQSISKTKTSEKAKDENNEDGS